MVITQTTEYGLRAVVYLASAGESATSSTISEATGAPLGYLPKILGTLCKAGILDSQRGVGGGFILARDPRELTVLEVVQALEPRPHKVDLCPLGRPDHLNLCPLHRLLARQVTATEAAFGAATIQSLLEPPDGPACEGVARRTPNIILSDKT